MATGATFQPSQGSDPIGAIQSYMQRAQAYRNTKEDQDMQRAEFRAKLPVIQAEAQMRIVGAKAAIDTATQMTQLQTLAAAKSPEFNQRFQEINLIPDFGLKANALQGLMGEIAWMKQLPQYKGFVEAVNNTMVDASHSELAITTLNETRTRAEEAAQARLDAAAIAAGSRENVAQTNAGRSMANANIRTASNERIAQIRADNSLDVVSQKGRVAAEKTAATLQILNDKAAEADQEAANASRDGNENEAAAHRQVAATYRDAVQKATTFAGSTPSAPRDKSQDPRPTPRSASEPAPQPITFSPGETGHGGEPTAQPKLYSVDPASKTPTISPEAKTPAQILAAVQQMVNDGAIDAATARATLTKLGFKPKQ